MVTVGCPKNEADSDSLSSTLSAAGHRPVVAEAADVIIVNTCGFIDAAKEESIDVVLAAAALARRTGARLAVIGCLVSLYGAQLREALPEVDLFTAFEQAPLVALLEAAAEPGAGSAAGRRAGAAGEAATASAVSPPTGVARGRRPIHAFVKISDGCDRPCAFCAIPLIKGHYEVVPPSTILRSAERALTAGARELVLVGQDTSRWTWPGYGGPARLLADLKSLGAHWLRLLYLQPDGVDDALLDAVAEHAVPYLDVPLQHADGAVLRKMGRRGDGRAFLALLKRFRDRVPGVAVRSTFLVGHPGETGAAFETLVAFVRAADLALAGVFVFDPQDCTRAATMRDRVPAAVTEHRAALLSEEIERAARPFWERLVGRPLEVLVERGVRDPQREAVGRICYQAPDVDGVTYVTGRSTRRGAVLRALPADIIGYDVHAVAEQPTAGVRHAKGTR
ncbi:MAG: MiaB/RimO family radical SAM methylthiotransferase [Actinobacteria bacterium]|nr:MiaB/RimO family radical SAM methylthiotransferase [Actinomycetota bacterium]